MNRTWSSLRRHLAALLGPRLSYLSKKNIYAQQWDAYVNAFPDTVGTAAGLIKWPGDEWGTGFRFAGPGCWHITVRRDDAVGGIAVRVANR